MKYKFNTSFAEEMSDINFNGFLDWFINIKPIEPFWNAQPTYIISQISYTIGAVSTFIHAFNNGGRWPYLWFGTILHGIMVEAICFILPDVDNYWHSQTPIMFLGRRLPLHILTLYAFFIYQASVAVNRLNLPKWSEPFAVGATVVLIDMPYDITCIKFVHFTWHDTDPNIGDRMYWVPWNSYYFHCTFASSFTFWFHFVRKFQIPNLKKWESSGFIVEMKSIIVTALFAAPGGILMFIPIYHTLHDIFGVHSEVTFFILFSIVLVIVWSGDRLEKQETPYNDKNRSSCSIFLMISLAIHYLVYLLMVIFGKPENELSTGLHETTGPCNVTQPLQTISGVVLKKMKYLCVNNYDEAYYDFSCIPNGPPKGIAKWYTICGTKFENRAEYISILGIITIIASIYFYTVHYHSIKRNNKFKTP